MKSEVIVSLTPIQDDLWKMFHKEVNEMIVTKAGRNFFPKLEYNVKGLDSNKFYAMRIHMELADDNRYKFSNRVWMHSGKGDEQMEGRKPFHADGVRTGQEWMNTTISFDRVKITNDMKASNPCMIPLHSMHKYVPVLTIFEAPSDHPFAMHSTSEPIASVRIPHTEFVAVTAYQNQRIIDLKIQFNSYAKGFRKEKQESRKRKADPMFDYSTDESSSKSCSPYNRSSSSSPPEISTSPFPTIASPINPYFFPFPNFSGLTPTSVSPQMPFPLSFFFNPLTLPIPSVEKEEKDSEEDVDVTD
ncbi:unnamed protein product [Caenorhabditis brenneri]